MIVGLIGKITKKEPTLLNVNVNGIIYEVFVSLNCSSKIISEEVKLEITHIIREDAQSLYGFLDINLSMHLKIDKLIHCLIHLS